jgi:hypothetical protein
MNKLKSGDRVKILPLAARGRSAETARDLLLSRLESISIFERTAFCHGLLDIFCRNRVSSAKPIFVEIEIGSINPGATYADLSLLVLPCANGSQARGTYYATDLTFSRMIRGWRAAIRSNPIAGPSGRLRPCSQFRRV